jgi:N-carbamoylputrescine amidase
MQAALVVHHVEAGREANLQRLAGLAQEAARQGADLALFAEAAVTGLVNNDDPDHDLPLGEPIPGPSTDCLAALCRDLRLWLGFGLLERDGDCLYDSAVLLDPRGAIALTYRRNQPQWHGRDADPRVYRQGSDVGKATTPFGTVAFLLCGDLFDDGIAGRLRDIRPNWLLFPFARCFGDGSVDQRRWDTEELPEYLARVRLVGVPTLMVNYLGSASIPGDNSFGGAFAVSATGEVVASLPLGREGMLLVDLDV